MSWFYALVRSKIINRNFTFMIRLGLCSQKPYEKYRLGCRRVRTQSCWDIYPAARYHQLALPVACGSRSNLPRIGQSALVSSTKNWPISARIIYQKLANQRSYFAVTTKNDIVAFRASISARIATQKLLHFSIFRFASDIRNLRKSSHLSFDYFTSLHFL